MIALSCWAVAASEPVPADDRAWRSYPEGLIPAADPLRFVIETALDDLEKRQEPDSSTSWNARAPGLKRALARSLGLDPMPPRTPLNARITGRAEREFYTIENLLFESRPGFYVTANVYTPKGIDDPMPAVVVAAGHAMEDGKNRDLYQLGQLSLVKQGMIVLAFDPIGQGERMLPGFAHNLGYGSLLVGQTNEGMIVWDAIRAIDYLSSRPEVDPGRMGITGNSGGGELAFYAMPLDDRIMAGASFCFVCSYAQWIEHGGSHCICNHLPGITREMEQFEIIGLNAPRAFLAGNGTEDKIFPIEGVRETLRRAGAIYAQLDAEDHIDGVEVPMPHGWSQPLREAGAAWMSHWLAARDRVDAIPESGITAEAPSTEALLALKGAGMPPGAETVVTLNRKLAQKQREAYATPPADMEDWAQRATVWRQDIWATLGGEPEVFEPAARTVSSFLWDGLQIEVLSIEVEPGMEIGATLVSPDDGVARSTATLFVGGFEQRGPAIRDGRVTSFARQGVVLVLDPRGTGESAGNLNQLASDGIVFGRPLFAQQVWDLAQSARWLEKRYQEVSVNGAGDGALLAIVAAALDAPFAQISVTDLLASYSYYLEDEQPQSIALSVPGILKVVDIPQLIALAGPAPIQINGLIGYARARLEADAAFKSMAYPRAIAMALGRPGALQVR